jgi:hypothetical protein
MGFFERTILVILMAAKTHVFVSSDDMFQVCRDRHRFFPWNAKQKDDNQDEKGYSEDYLLH